MNDRNDPRELLDCNLRSLDIEIGAGRKAAVILRYCAGSSLMLKDGREGTNGVIYLSSGEARLLVRWLTMLLDLTETPAPIARPQNLTDILRAARQAPDQSSPTHEEQPQ